MGVWQKRCLALDIDETGMKALLLQMRAWSDVVWQACHIHLSDQAPWHDPDGIYLALKQICQRWHLKRVPVCTNLPLQYIVELHLPWTRSFFSPWKKQLLRSPLVLQALPWDIKETCMDAFLIGEQSKQVRIVATRKSIIQLIDGVIQSAGMSLCCLDLSAHNLPYLLQHQQACVLWIDMHTSVTELVLCAQKRLLDYQRTESVDTDTLLGLLQQMYQAYAFTQIYWLGHEYFFNTVQDWANRQQIKVDVWLGPIGLDAKYIPAWAMLSRWRAR